MANLVTTPSVAEASAHVSADAALVAPSIAPIDGHVSASAVSLTTTTAYYYRTSGGARSSTTNTASIPAGAVIERVA